MKQTKMGFGFLLAAGFFLFEPIIGVQDALPNAIGYLLLCLGLSRPADLNERLADAQKGFRAAIWVALGRMLAWVLTDVLLTDTGETLNRYEQPVWVLLFAFAFLVLEWWFLLPAWKNFFKGFSDLSEFHGGTALQQEKKGRSHCERLQRLTSRVVVLQSLLTVLPELTVLTSFENDVENPLFPFDWYQFAGLFRRMAAVVGILVGLYWLAKYLYWTVSAQRDGAWQEELEGQYRTQVLSNTALLVRRRTGAAFTFFRVGIVFLADLSLMYHGVLPDCFSVLLFGMGWLMLGELLHKSRAFWACAFLLCGAGIARMVLSARYLRDYTPRDALHLPNAYDRYLILQIVGVCETLLMLLFVCLLLWSLVKMLWEPVEPNAARYEGYRSELTEARMRQALRRRALLAVGSAVLSTGLKVGEICFSLTLGWFWLLQFFGSFLAILAFSSFLGELSEQLEERYPLRGNV